MNHSFSHCSNGRQCWQIFQAERARHWSVKWDFGQWEIAKFLGKVRHHVSLWGATDQWDRYRRDLNVGPKWDKTFLIKIQFLWNTIMFVRTLGNSIMSVWTLGNSIMSIWTLGNSGKSVWTLENSIMSIWTLGNSIMSVRTPGNSEIASCPSVV